MGGYVERVVDQELDELMSDLAAIAIEGPKGVGKTATAARRADAVISLDDSDQRGLLAADPGWLDRTPGTVLIDEWQRHPSVWDEVRRHVDQGATPGRYLLAGSAAPVTVPTHSGAGRIVQLRMRPMSLAERGLEKPTISLRSLLQGGRLRVEGETMVDLSMYLDEIVGSGFPGIRPLSPRARRIQLDGYLARVIERDFSDQGHPVKRPNALRAWLRAYAAATASTAAYNAILDAATPGDGDKPSKPTTAVYRDVLSQLWLLDPVPGWLPIDNPLGRLAQSPKHHLADPALAARLLNLDSESLLTASGGTNRLGRCMIGPLFESLMALSLQVYARAAEGRVEHLRTRNGDHEVDYIVTGLGGRVVAIEVKLSRTIEDQDTAQLHWLREKLGSQLVDAVVVNTGRYAYRRPDGIAVVPAALLGP